MSGYYRPNSYQELFMAMDLQANVFENDNFGEWLMMSINRYQKAHKKTKSKKKTNKKVMH